MGTQQLLPIWMTAANVAINGTSMASTITSDSVEIEFKDNVGIHVVWTGTPTGTFAVQVSHDPTNLGWISIPDSAYTVAPTQPTGAAGSNFFDLNQLGAGYVRLLYTAGSGSGALKAKIAVKSV